MITEDLVAGDDGIVAQEVGEWAKDKYSVHQIFCQIFTAGMRNKWDELVYLDLFAGTGRALLRDSRSFIPTAAMNAVTLEHPFTSYIFADIDQERLTALKNRIATSRPQLVDHCSYEPVDSNNEIHRILRHVPPFSPNRKGLIFCFLDPFALSQIKFATISEISRFYADFLILLPTSYDVNRNRMRLLNTSPKKSMEEALGSKEWRSDWKHAEREGIHFKAWFVDAFCAKMTELRYLPRSRMTLKRFQSDGRLDLYHLGFFSRSNRGHEFWEQATKYGTKQTDLFLS